MKTAISLPDELFARVDSAARARGVNRSQFFATAAAHYLSALEQADASADIDAALAQLDEDAQRRESTDESLARLAALTAGDDWASGDDRAEGSDR